MELRIQFRSKCDNMPCHRVWCFLENFLCPIFPYYWLQSLTIGLYIFSNCSRQNIQNALVPIWLALFLCPHDSHFYITDSASFFDVNYLKAHKCARFQLTDCLFVWFWQSLSSRPVLHSLDVEIVSLLINQLAKYGKFVISLLNFSIYLCSSSLKIHFVIFFITRRGPFVPFERSVLMFEKWWTAASFLSCFVLLSAGVSISLLFSFWSAVFCFFFVCCIWSLWFRSGRIRSVAGLRWSYLLSFPEYRFHFGHMLLCFFCVWYP